MSICASVTGVYPRVARRRAQDRARILAVAAAKFAVSGPDAVTLDEIGAAADVARATLYSHFESKEALIAAIVRPLLEEGAALLSNAGAETDASSALDRLLEVYVVLYRRFPDALRVSYMVQGRPLGELARAHRAFMRRALAVFERVGAAGLLRSSDASLAARALARIAIPVLETFAERADCHTLFKASVRGFLVR